MSYDGTLTMYINVYQGHTYTRECTKKNEHTHLLTSSNLIYSINSMYVIIVHWGGGVE